MGLRFDVETDAPATSAAVVSPNDSTDLTTYARMLYVGGAGSLKVTTVDGDTFTFPAITAGSLIPLRVKRVWLTPDSGTIATGIIALH
jgi:hypothetical protein